MQALLLRSLAINSIKKQEKSKDSSQLNEALKKDNKIEYICNCDLKENKHKENCIYNLV